MSKFNKFLEEQEVRSGSDKITQTHKQTLKQSTVDYSSLKIKMDTLDTLRKVKLVAREQSYSALIDKMLDVYIEQLSTEEKKSIKALLQ